MIKHRLSVDLSIFRLRFAPLYRLFGRRGKTGPVVVAALVLTTICLAVLTMGAVRLKTGSFTRVWEWISATRTCHDCGQAGAPAKPAQTQASFGTFANFDVTGAGTTALEGTLATSINATGDVAGVYITTGNVSHGFERDSSGKITPFDASGAGTANDQGTFALSIDADGNIVGMYADSSNVYHGFLRSSGGSIAEFNVSAAGTTGHRGTVPTSVNGGVAVGTYVTGSSGTTSVYHGFKRAANETLTFPIDVPGAGTGDTQGTMPSCINSAGDITGTYKDAGGVSHGFIYNGTTFTYPIDPSGSVATFPASIDTLGDITGVYLDSSGLMHGFVRTAAGAISSFDPPGASTTPPGSGKGVKLDGTIAGSINTAGTIAGFYTDNNKVGHGFFRNSAGTISSPLDDSDAGTGTMEGTAGLSINDSGMIAGLYIDSNEVLHGFVFTPNSSGSPAVTFTPTSLNFGSQAEDTTSAVKSVTVKNTGTATLDISSIAASGDFAISAKTCGTTLAAGKTCKVSVTFTPKALGALTGTLGVTDNASGSPQTAALSGTGVVAAKLTPAKATYAKQKVGTTSAAKTFTLTNEQPVALTSIVISTTGDFKVSAKTCATSLVAKAKCTISVTFTPKATGTRTGQLSVSDSAAGSPQAASLTGTGD
ncbi:MAG: choice-of-anchor D domain-containing protein [Terriglobales bacterium]